MERRSGFSKLIVAGISLLMTEKAVAENPTAEAKFVCQGGKKLAAAFYPDLVAPM